MKRLFGTDGIRGIANQDLTGELAYKVGLATAKMLKIHKFRITKDSPFNDNNPVVIIGRDTRKSGDMLLAGISCGLCAGGVNVVDLGVLPTPAVAYLAKKYSFASVGIMITASHNPKEYNGIKIIGSDGYKLADELEEQVEELISNIDSGVMHDFFSENSGRICNNFAEKARKDYIDYIKSLFSFNKNNSLMIAVDCSNGSASTCYNVFKESGIFANEYNVDLSGENINDGCGSMHLEFLQDIIKENKGRYDCGIAFDGDADRCLLIDENGEVVDGDHILAIMGNYLKAQNKLNKNTIVGTVMSNLGLINFCKANDINFLSTKVGDKYVLEEMIMGKCSLGGEQSGHIIFRDYATTGDGILTALMILDVMDKTATPLSELKNQMTKYPQTSMQIPATSNQKNDFLANLHLKETIQSKANDILGEDGRVVVRPSGTENCIRIMVEGKDETIINNLCVEIAESISSAIN